MKERWASSKRRTNCVEKTRVSRIKVEDGRRKAVFINERSAMYCVAKVDNCLITEGVRSDFLVSEEGVASVFVELKAKTLPTLAISYGPPLNTRLPSRCWRKE